MNEQHALKARRSGGRAVPRLCLLVILVALTALIPRAQQAHADTTGECQLIGTSTTCPVFGVPYFLNLNQSLYAATDVQTQSLIHLEGQAVTNTLQDHGLPNSDANAVATWGRYDVEAELFALIEQAITTSASSRTTDQQNAVDWVSAVEQRQAEQAAQDAGLEYVKWAGLGQLSYQQLLNTTASESALQTFLCGGNCSAWQTTVQPYNNTNPSLATGGYCVYHPPAPYGSEYNDSMDQTCFAPCTSVLGCSPPTPSYDQFAKWGEAAAANPSLSSSQSEQAAGLIATGLIFGGVAVGAGATTAVALSTGMASALVGSALQDAIFPLATRVNYNLVLELGQELAEAATEEVAAEGIASAAGAIVGALIFAITTAVIEGINVANAAALPSQLATLIVNARTTVPDPATLLTSSNGASSLFSLFVGATQPIPRDETCDNSLIPPTLYGSGETWISPTGALINTIPCLNPTAIPPASATDPQFVVQAKGATAQQASPTITWVDTALKTTLTARLSGNWFIDQSTGSSASAQTLTIPYTDWNGKEQIAWLVGNSTTGYHFIGYSVAAGTSTALAPSTCLTNGTCWSRSTIDYVGSNGQDYSASVQGYQPPVGSPSNSTAVEGSPVTFNANGYKPGSATGTVHYEWRFQKAGCGIPCISVDPTTLTSGPAYTDAVTGDTATYTWQTSGSYLVQLTATDSIGVQTTDTFTVSVDDVAPSLVLYPDCASISVPTLCDMRTGDAGTSLTLTGTVSHTGTLDSETVTVDWGDGSTDSARGGPPLTLGGTSLILTPSTDQTSFTLSGSHAYAKPGVYSGMVRVSDGSGGADSEAFTETIHGWQSISFPAIPSHIYGDAPFAISATGGASGQPVSFAVTGDSSVCSLSGAGNPSVTVLKPGVCAITASQAGSATYHAAQDVTQSFTVQPAPLTVTASSPSIAYGDTAPTITPRYSGFVNNETSSVLTTQASCSVAPNSGAAGTYQTSCTGASAPNYSITYVPGTLTIKQAPLTVNANNKSMTYGGSVPTFDAGYSGLLNGDAGSVVNGLTCGAVDGSNNPVSGTTPAGQYTISCSGGSAANYTVSYQPGTLTITKAHTSVTLPPASASSVFGQPVTLTAGIAVTSPGSGHPGGTVEFKDGGTDISGCAAQPVSTTTETATCTTASLSVAAHSITASYSGDVNFVGTSSVLPSLQTVYKAASTITLVPSAPSTQGQPATFTAVVAAASPGAGTPGGTVTFHDGATALGTGQLGAAGGKDQATFSTSSLVVGAHTITASYGGDGNFTTSTSTALTQDVNTNLSSYPKLSSGAYNLSNANLSGGYFVGVNLTGAGLIGSNLTNAVFLNANLNGANLSGSNYVSGANFTGANLSNANLSNSNFKGANFSNVNLSGANLSNTNLKGATGFTTATLTNVIWSNTACPDGSDSNADGGTCVGHL